MKQRLGEAIESSNKQDGIMMQRIEEAIKKSKQEQAEEEERTPQDDADLGAS